MIDLLAWLWNQAAPAGLIVLILLLMVGINRLEIW